MALLSDSVDIASNEYLTKFSINRNFEKLLSNDVFLSSIVGYQKVNFYSYNQNKKYDLNDLVLYKTDPSSLKIYLLCSLINNNYDPPSCVENLIGEKIVISSDSWGLVGIPKNTGGKSPTDIADEYVQVSKTTFKKNHEENTDLSAHPSGPLGRENSNILLMSFKNIKQDRKTFFYPYKIQKLQSDNTIQNGYLRKWDNGIIEYDLTFKVGFSGEYTEDGNEILSANNVDIRHRNYNYLYFRDKADYNIFKQGGDKQAIVNNQRQVNLNKYVNAYSSQITFPEEFKDLNYMVYASGVKNITTRTWNTKNEAISEFDSRLYINGLTIEGHEPPEDIEKGPSKKYRETVSIPYQVTTIGDQSLKDIKWGLDSSSYQINPVAIYIPTNSNLENIGDEAFTNSNIVNINIPKNVKRIGERSFANCSKLNTLNFYVYRDPAKQPKIELNAFLLAPIEVVNIYYVDEPMLFSASQPSEEERRLSAYSNEIQLSSRFSDPLLREFQLGIQNKVIINNIYPSAPSFSANNYQNQFSYSNFNSNDEDIIEISASLEQATTSNLSSDDYISFDVQDFLNKNNQSSSYFESSQNSIEVENKKENGLKKNKQFLSTKMFSASISAIDRLTAFFNIEAKTSNTSAIVGYKSTLPNNFSLDFTNPNYNDETISGLTAIASNALKNCTKITSFVGCSPLKTIQDNAFNGCTSLDNLIISSGITYVGKNSFSNCGEITYCGLSCPSDSTYSYQSTTFAGNTSFENLSILPYFDTSKSEGSLTITAKNLCVDMTNSFTYAKAFDGSKIESIYAVNIKKGKKKTIPGYGVLSTFSRNTFENCWTKRCVIWNDRIEEISAIFWQEVPDPATGGKKNANLLDLSSETILKIQDQTVAYISEDMEELNTFSQFLEVDELTVIGFNNVLFQYMSDPTNPTVEIPYLIREIKSDAFCPDPGYETQIWAVSMPKKLKIIGDRAFKGNSGILAFRNPDNLKLEYIGKDVFAGCTALPSLYFLSSAV